MTFKCWWCVESFPEISLKNTWGSWQLDRKIKIIHNRTVLPKNYNCNCTFKKLVNSLHKYIHSVQSLDIIYKSPPLYKPINLMYDFFPINGSAVNLYSVNYYRTVLRTTLFIFSIIYIICIKWCTVYCIMYIYKYVHIINHTKV